MRYRQLLLVFMVASRLAGAAEADSVDPPARLVAPTLGAQAIGPTMIRLTVTAAPGASVVLVERTADGHPPEQTRVASESSAKGGPVVRVVGALPGTTYVYRAKVVAGGGSDWSNPVSVGTPPAPTTPPAPPADLTARAVSAFAVELRWKDHSDDEYGFELERRDGAAFVRVVLLDPGTTRFVHHGRVPESELVYRVRAFNAAGVSASSNEATARTPGVSDAPAVPPTPWNQQERASGPGPCTTVEKVRQADPGELAPLEGRIEYGEGRALDLFAGQESCGNANCSWVAYGTYDGCYRELGFVGGVGTEVVTTTKSGLPVLVGVGHGSAREYGGTVLQIVDGRLLEIDDWMACEPEDEGDLMQVAPPFENCQRDGDLWTAQPSTTPH